MTIEKDMPARRMEVQGLMMDPSSRTPIVILREAGGEALLPIWIGLFEANAIAMCIEGVETPRPMTHDLLSDSLEVTGTRIEKIVISDLSESTFFASIYLEIGVSGEVVTLDSRPSDAIALALRAAAPIFVLESVLETARLTDRAKEDSAEDRLKKWLEEAAPDDLGDYKM
jgi:bifunctional DNase/RNase